MFHCFNIALLHYCCKTCTMFACALHPFALICTPLHFVAQVCTQLHVCCTPLHFVALSLHWIALGCTGLHSLACVLHFVVLYLHMLALDCTACLYECCTIFSLHSFRFVALDLGSDIAHACRWFALLYVIALLLQLCCTGLSQVSFTGPVWLIRTGPVLVLKSQ